METEEGFKREVALKLLLKLRVEITNSESRKGQGWTFPAKGPR